MIVSLGRSSRVIGDIDVLMRLTGYGRPLVRDPWNKPVCCLWDVMLPEVKLSRTWSCPVSRMAEGIDS